MFRSPFRPGVTTSWLSFFNDKRVTGIFYGFFVFFSGFAIYLSCGGVVVFVPCASFRHCPADLLIFSSALTRTNCRSLWRLLISCATQVWKRSKVD